MGKPETLSVNVRGINTNEKKVNIHDWLTTIKVDIDFLQERSDVEKRIKYNSRGLENFNTATLIPLSAVAYQFYYEKIFILK